MKEIEITDEVLSLANVLPFSNKGLAWDTDTVSYTIHTVPQ